MVEPGLTSDISIRDSGVQMLHVHVFLVTPLGASDMPKPGANQHKGRVSVWKGAHDTGASADFSVKSFNVAGFTNRVEEYTKHIGR